MKKTKAATCCFSGYRAAKMPFSESDPCMLSALYESIDDAIISSFKQGYTTFITGMSSGFDLWAAERVLALRRTASVSLTCAIPFELQAHSFSPYWKKLYNDVLIAADNVFLLSKNYHAGCFAVRNRFMIDASAKLICYFTGIPGGTAQTVHLALRNGIEISNLAQQTAQLAFHPFG